MNNCKEQMGPSLDEARAQYLSGHTPFHMELTM